jgi:hypothetical protein
VIAVLDSVEHGGESGMTAMEMRPLRGGAMNCYDTPHG